MNRWAELQRFMANQAQADSQYVPPSEEEMAQAERGAITNSDVSRMEAAPAPKPKGSERVWRCDDSWERGPTGIKLVRKNCRWEPL